MSKNTNNLLLIGGVIVIGYLIYKDKFKDLFGGLGAAVEGAAGAVGAAGEAVGAGGDIINKYFTNITTVADGAGNLMDQYMKGKASFGFGTVTMRDPTLINTFSPKGITEDFNSITFNLLNHTVKTSGTPKALTPYKDTALVTGATAPTGTLSNTAFQNIMNSGGSVNGAYRTSLSSYATRTGATTVVPTAPSYVPASLRVDSLQPGQTVSYSGGSVSGATTTRTQQATSSSAPRLSDADINANARAATYSGTPVYSSAAAYRAAGTTTVSTARGTTVTTGGVSVFTPAKVYRP